MESQARKCKWRTESCQSCTSENPFSTESVCTAAIMLYYASGNILCPKCADGYLTLTKNKQYTCSKCTFTAGYEIVLDSFMLE